MTIYLSLVDHALHHDAGLHPQRCGGLRCGCLLWTQRGCLAPAAMVRLLSTLNHTQSTITHFSLSLFICNNLNICYNRRGATHGNHVGHTFLVKEAFWSMLSLDLFRFRYESFLVACCEVNQFPAIFYARSLTIFLRELFFRTSTLI